MSNIYQWLLSKSAGDGLKTYSEKQKELREAAALEAQQAAEAVPATE